MVTYVSELIVYIGKSFTNEDTDSIDQGLKPGSLRLEASGKPLHHLCHQIYEYYIYE